MIFWDILQLQRDINIMILLEKKRCFISRDVNFFENEPYFKKQDITQESYTIDHNGTVLPQPPVFGNIRNARNLET